MVKVLMFGWEFPPYNSGGLGTACQGLTQGLSKIGTDVIFVLPKALPLDVPYMKLIYSDEFQKRENIDLKVKTSYFFNSVIHPYITPQNYKEKINSSYVENMGSNGVQIYQNDLFAEVERYGELGAHIAKNEDFDVIHAHDWLTFKAGILAKEISGKPLIVHIHATEFDRTGGSGHNSIFQIEKEGMDMADVIISVSNFTKRLIVEKYDIPENKIRVVHNSIDFEEYAVEKISELKEKNKIVLFLGRLTLQKGPDYFVSAAKKVLDYYKEVIFIIVGGGDMEKQIIEKVAQMGIAHKVLFAGFLRGNDLKKVWKMADLYIMPSVSEPFGIAPLEAIMHGSPVIISKQSGVSEKITNCLKVDFWDVDEMTNKIVSVLSHKSLSNCLKENGYNEIKNWSWEEPATKCNEIYGEFIGVRV